jgi:hypothetical protein
MNNEFVFAVMKNYEGEYVIVNAMPESYSEKEPLYSPGEIEYVANRVVYDLQSRRAAELFAERFTPQQTQVSKKVREALNNRQKES